MGLFFPADSADSLIPLGGEWIAPPHSCLRTGSPGKQRAVRGRLSGKSWPRQPRPGINGLFGNTAFFHALLGFPASTPERGRRGYPVLCLFHGFYLKFLFLFPFLRLLFQFRNIPPSTPSLNQFPVTDACACKSICALGRILLIPVLYVSSDSSFFKARRYLDRTVL